ncbi:hypothetical protein PT974_09570 [Cladobotryum mycophilum]|uniref:2EXR domain-containing protein n=1 Tax=Cladobotryum mycophilum TaxID=491253 RepID=A0ABR0SHQ5_9HYPO
MSSESDDSVLEYHPEDFRETDRAAINFFLGGWRNSRQEQQHIGSKKKSPCKAKEPDNSTKTFHQFGDLPTELRRFIWAAALPEDEPTIYMYGKRYADPHRDPDWSARKERGEKLPAFLVQAAMPPLVWASREARAAVMEWVKRKGYTLGFRKETRGHILSRPFDIERDVLYVPAAAWEEDFSHEAFIMTDEDADAGISDMYKNIKHLALPAYTAIGSMHLLMQLFEFMPNLETISVVWDELPTMRYKQSALAARPTTSRRERLETAVQPRWELELLDIEGTDEVRMSVEGEDSTFKRRRWEHGVLAEYMGTMRFELEMPSEMPSHMLDDNGQLLLELRPVKASLRT